MSNSNFYDPLIHSFDCIGWIPTIRGSLSLDLLDPKFLLGDTDKYLVDFEYLSNFKSSRYIVSSSLISYDDSKHFGNKYSRVFRFFFRGSINDEKEKSDFSNLFENKDQIMELFQKKKLLIGKITIISNLTNRINDNEILALEGISQLQNTKAKYKKAYLEDADSLEKLESLRGELKEKYNHLRDKLNQIELLNEDNINYRVWKFDVTLSRDGILFLRNDTNSAFLKDFYVEDSASDYKKNIPIHRIFKISMTYIKYLFHKHYHHESSNDTFLPVTNLYPVRATNNTSKITDHQIEFFLKQITKYKRDPRRLLCNPAGVTNYARAFLDVFGNNGFVEEIEILQIHNFINYQENDTKIILGDNRNLRNFFLTQNNILASLAIGITFMLAIIPIIKFVVGEQEILGYSIYRREAILATSFFLGFGLQIFVVKLHLSKNFDSKVKRRNKSFFKRILFCKSNLEKKRLSILYDFYLWLIETKLKISTFVYEIIVLSVIITFLTIIAITYIALVQSIT